MTGSPITEGSNSRLVSLRQVSGAGLANVSYLVIQSLLFVVMTPWVLKALGLEVYGLWTILAAITGFASLTNCGIGSGVTKYVSEFSVAEAAGAKISAVVSFGFVFLLLAGLLTGMLVFIVRHWLAAKIVHQAGEAPLLADALAIAAWGIALVFLTQLPKSVLFGLVYHKVVGAVDVAQSVSIQLAALIIGLQGGGIVPLAYSIFAINLASLVVLAWIALHVTRPLALYFTLNRGLARQIFHYSSFAWISGLGIILFTQGDRILVGMILGPAAAGAYAICTGVAARLNSLAGSATQVLVPFASSYQAAGKIAEVAKVYLHLLRLLGCLLAATGLVLILWSQWILTIWISPEFSLAYGRVFVILILAYALFSMAAPGYYIAFGLGHPEVPALLAIGGALLMLLLISILSPIIGLSGAALANIGYSLQLILLLNSAKQLGINNIKPILRTLVPPMIILLAPLYFYNYTITFKLAMNISLIMVLSWLAMNNGRLSIILKSIKNNTITFF
jgi:O-antigen/teichoic acid export membrane protein